MKLAAGAKICAFSWTKRMTMTDKVALEHHCC
jgi:hypothetical protein